MPISFLFWGVMFLWLILGLYRDWGNHYLVGGNILVFICLALLGWKVFGAAIHG